MLKEEEEEEEEDEEEERKKKDEIPWESIHIPNGATTRKKFEKMSYNVA